MCMEDASRCQRLVSHASSFAPVESCTSGARQPRLPPRQHANMPSAPTHHTHTPNVDNIAMLVLDAINSRVFVDSQLC